MSNTARFEWRHEGAGDDEWQEVAAFDAYFAAEAAAEAYDQDERAMLKTGHCEVFEIRCIDDPRPKDVQALLKTTSEITRWSVRGESEPTYYPHQIS